MSHTILNVLQLVVYSFYRLWQSNHTARSSMCICKSMNKWNTIKRQIKSMLISKKMKVCQILYMLDIVGLQYLYQPNLEWKFAYPCQPKLECDVIYQIIQILKVKWSIQDTQFLVMVILFMLSNHQQIWIWEESTFFHC